MSQDISGIRVISGLSNGSAGSAAIYSQASRNVIGGIASVTSLTVTGISTFVGDVYISGNLYVSGSDNSDIIDGGTY